MGTAKDIRDAVKAELEFDPLVDDADIDVVNIFGDMALNGTVPSYPQYLEAAAAAQRVAGVRIVQNHLQVVLPDEDYRDDALLTTAANNALAVNVTVPDGVEVIARDGNLTLTGMVKYGQQRKSAERAVTGLTGVRYVKDDIDISYDADPIDVTWFVQDALDRNALVGDDSDVSVDTSGNTVTLRGHVRTWAERDAVVSAAWMAGSVVQVRDDLAAGVGRVRPGGLLGDHAQRLGAVGRPGLLVQRDAVAGLRRQAISREDREVLLSILDEETSRLNRLVTDLLRYARPVNIQRSQIALADLLGKGQNDDQIVAALYERVLARKPTDEEQATCQRYVHKVGDRKEALEDVLWALVNSKEFAFNH